VGEEHFLWIVFHHGSPESTKTSLFKLNRFNGHQYRGIIGTKCNVVSFLQFVIHVIDIKTFWMECYQRIKNFT